MMFHVTSTLLNTCIQRRVPLPGYMRELVEEAIRYIGKPGAGLLVQETMMNFASLRADIYNKSLKDPDAIIARALELDSTLLSIMTNSPQGWEYETVFTDIDSEFVFDGRYHVYYDCWMGYMWNALRSVRIMLNQIIRDTLLEGFSSKPPRFIDSEHTAQFQISTDNLYEFQADILASVPHHLGCIAKSKDGSGYLFSWKPRSDGDMPGVRMHGGSFLLWPLLLAGIMDIATEKVRNFVYHNLKFIGNTMGINEAHVLAKMLQMNSDPVEYLNDTTSTPQHDVK